MAGIGIGIGPQGNTPIGFPVRKAKAMLYRTGHHSPAPAPSNKVTLPSGLPSTAARPV